MINGKDIYEVLSALVPLYVAMILAYGSVRWWKIFTPDQCSGINRFVAVFAVPLLNFHFISSDNLYAMNLRFIAADSLQKVVILVALFLWQCLRKHGDLGWTITLFSLSTLPNTLVLGIPLLNAMYGEYSGNLMVQIVVLQAVVWYTLLLFLFEYRAAKELISQQIPPELASEIASFRVDSDVRSLSGLEPVLAETEVGQDGKIQMVLRRSTSHDNNSVALMNLRESLSRIRGMDLRSFQWATLAEATPGDLEEMKTDYFTASSHNVASPGNTLALSELGAYNSINMSYRRTSSLPNWKMSRGGRVASVEFKDMDSCHSPRQQKLTALGESHACNDAASLTGEMHMKDGCRCSSCRTSLAGSRLFARRSNADMETGEQGSGNRHNIPSGVMTRLIAIMVWRKLVRNPNTYASIIGLVWSLVSFRWNVEMPKMVKGSISILSNTGLGMAMFSLGLFMALQPSVVACGKSAAALAMAIRFLVGPAVTGATSAAIGIRHDLLRVAIVQAALPEGIVPFVFAKEYGCYADIASTSVVFGLLLAVPVTLVYYVLLGL